MGLWANLYRVSTNLWHQPRQQRFGRQRHVFGTSVSNTACQMRSLIRSLLQLARCSSGSALVESVLVIPAAISVMIGVVGFGQGFATWATGSKSVRDAARYLGNLPYVAVTDLTTGAWVGCPAWAVTDAQNLAIYGNTVPGSLSPLVPGWQANGGSNNNVSVDCSTPWVIVVTANFPYNPVMPTPFVSLGTTLTLSAQHREPFVHVSN